MYFRKLLFVAIFIYANSAMAHADKCPHTHESGKIKWLEPCEDRNMKISSHQFVVIGEASKNKIVGPDNCPIDEAKETLEIEKLKVEAAQDAQSKCSHTMKAKLNSKWDTRSACGSYYEDDDVFSAKVSALFLCK